MDGELQELPNGNRRRTGIQVTMAKGRGIPICLGLLFSCCALGTALLVGLALLLRFGEEPLIDGQVTEVIGSYSVCTSYQAAIIHDSVYCAQM